MDGPPLFDEAALEVGWEALLEQEPTALVAAIGADGIFVPVPDSLARNGHGTLPGRSAMDFVVPEDWERIIEAWARARRTGAGRAVVRLAAAPQERVVVYYFDARHRHGVYLGVLLGARP